MIEDEVKGLAERWAESQGLLSGFPDYKNAVTAFCAGYKASQPKTMSEKFDPARIILPSWIPRLAWVMWCDERKAKNKRITARAAELQVKKLTQYMREGHDPAAVIAFSIECGYQGLFPPKKGATALDEPAWRKEQRERTQLAAPGVAARGQITGAWIDELPQAERIK